MVNLRSECPHLNKQLAICYFHLHVHIRLVINQDQEVGILKLQGDLDFNPTDYGGPCLTKFGS